jgi:hypothetical protein
MTGYSEAIRFDKGGPHVNVKRLRGSEISFELSDRFTYDWEFLSNPYRALDLCSFQRGNDSRVR